MFPPLSLGSEFARNLGEAFVRRHETSPSIAPASVRQMLIWWLRQWGEVDARGDSGERCLLGVRKTVGRGAMARGAQTVGRGAARPGVAPGSSFYCQGGYSRILTSILLVGSLRVAHVPLV